MQIRLNPVTLITGAGSGIGAVAPCRTWRANPPAGLAAGRYRRRGAERGGRRSGRGRRFALSASPPSPSTSPTWRAGQAAPSSRPNTGVWIGPSSTLTPPRQTGESDLVDWGRTTSAQLEPPFKACARSCRSWPETRRAAIVVTTAAAAIKAEPLAKFSARPFTSHARRLREALHFNVRINAIAPAVPIRRCGTTCPGFGPRARNRKQSAAFDKDCAHATPDRTLCRAATSPAHSHVACGRSAHYWRYPGRGRRRAL